MIGELSEKNLGIKEDELQRLKETVSIVYHSAATIKFNTHLRTAITINLIGTYRTIEFAKSLKKLDSYVYLSTAFCNSNQQSYIEEKVYTSVQDPYEMMKLVEDEKLWMRDSEAEINALVGNHPNTYTFTKQLAENLLLKEFAGYPAGIVRPSVGKFCSHPMQQERSNISNVFFSSKLKCMEHIKIHFKDGLGTLTAVIWAF